mgnify:CR=1 FL=1
MESFPVCLSLARSGWALLPERWRLLIFCLAAPGSSLFFPLVSLWCNAALFALALLVLRRAGIELDLFHKAVLVGLWAAAVLYFYWTLGSRTFLYHWDYVNYILKQYHAEAAFAQSAGAGLAYIFGSMADDYTNFITLFTEFPFCLTSHTGDDYSFSQVFCILPTLLVLLAGLVVKVGQILNVKNRRYYFLFGMTLTAAYPFLRMSAVLAQPDWFGLIFAFAILLLTLESPVRTSWSRCGSASSSWPLPPSSSSPKIVNKNPLEQSNTISNPTTTARLRAASPAVTASPIRFTQPISIRATATSLRAAELCAASSTPYTRSPRHPMGELPPTQAPSVWAVLGFFIPLVGLILWMIWKNDRPGDAGMAGKGALVSVIINVVLFILWIVFAGILFAASGSY